MTICLLLSSIRKAKQSRRARRSAREAGYWRHCKPHLRKTLVCFQSAITPSVIHRRIEGTIGSSTTLLMVPSISPYDLILPVKLAMVNVRHRERNGAICFLRCN